LVNTVYIGYFYFNRTKRMGNGRTENEPEDWIRIGCDAIIELSTFEAAQKRMKHNKAYVRKHPSRTYLLSGMVFCAECKHPYMAQTANANKNRRRNEAQSYRHRLTAGHCMNKQISARVLEPIVWEKVLEILLNPAALLEGYKQSLDAQRASQSRKLAQIQILEKGLLKVKMKRQNLNNAYLDPDIAMSKSEYVDQKVELDEEARTIENDLLGLRADITDMPEPSSVKALEKFADEILEGLFAEEEITLEKKKRLFEMMHLKVNIHPEGNVGIDGWFNIPEEDGLLPHPSKHYARLQPRLPARA
jgi:hypothetical protein